MPGAPGALLAGGGRVLQSQPFPALPVGRWEKSHRCLHRSAHLRVRARSRVAFSCLRHWVADIWCCSKARPCLSVALGSLSYGFFVIPFPLRISGRILACLLSIFCRGIRAACGCTTELVVLQSLQLPPQGNLNHVYESRLEKTEEVKRNLCAFSIGVCAGNLGDCQNLAGQGGL